MKVHWLLGAAAFMLALFGAGCSSLTAPLAEDRIVDLRTGRALARAALLEIIRSSDYALLGELHDNPEHHAARAELLKTLRPPAAVVAEHLPRGRRVVFGPDLAASLSTAGFDTQAWGWPLHAPLFAGIARAGLPLVGGNVARDVARRVAREGAAATPADLAAVITGAPLTEAAQAALDNDLVQGHCGHLPADRLPGMRQAQRARDASMWLALRESAGSPAVLLAGNGHVRLDYGVGQLIQRYRPDAEIVSVGFVEPGFDERANAPYTHLWITSPAKRKDPCAELAMPRR